MDDLLDQLAVAFPQPCRRADGRPKLLRGTSIWALTKGD